MKNYQHKQNTHALEFNSFDTIIAIIFVFFAMGMATLHGADFTYVIDLTEVLKEQDTLADALAFCEHWDGVYSPEEDTCTIKGVHHEYKY